MTTLPKRNNLSFIATIIFASALALVNSSYAFANASKGNKTEEDPFAHVVPCERYLSFLDNREKGDAAECQTLEAILISTQSKKLSDFFRIYEAEVEERTVLRMILNMQDSIISRDLGMSFFWADSSDREIYAKMELSGDADRAIFYTFMLIKIKYAVVRYLCDGKSECTGFDIDPTKQEIASGVTPELARMRPDFVTMCLLRTDAFVTPLKTVLDSKQFKNCIHTDDS